MQSTSNKTRNIYGKPQKTRLLPTRRVSGRLLLCVGLGLLIMLIGWLALSALGNWWQIKQDDFTYGRPRTFQVDAVVGHNGDSPTHPSHFLALNLNRAVIIIELPAGDPAKAVIYTAGTMLGDGQDLTPVTLSFAKGANGKVNMVIHIGDQEIIFTNNGTKFMPPEQN